MFRDPFYAINFIKPYKMCYIEDFIMKSIKEKINSKEVYKSMIYNKGREDLK